MEKGLDITSGLDSSVALKQYFARHGFRIGPHDRSGTPPYDESIVTRITRELDALRAPYRDELALPPFGRAPAKG